MAEFKLSDKVNPNKIFILKTSEIEKRLDPFYYIPEIKELEKKVREKNIKPLRYFVQNVSSGATPKTAEKEKYYSDKENGIPFLRVQNLSPMGILEYEDCKYINKETHNGYLKRSQVRGGDLLVKITGVGRMAVASVAPDDFVGNTNQHIVVIRTGSKEISTVLASYLNSDIGEKLASRRATGGTRPALDYPALLSIPILYDERISDITKKAVNEKNKKENEAEVLLESIDDYLLKELSIVLPEKDNLLESRIFTTTLKHLSGSRFDPFFNDKFYDSFITQLEKYPTFGSLIKVITKGETPLWRGDGYIEEGIPFLQVNNLSIDGVDNDYKRISLEVHNRMKRSILKGGEILYSMAGTIGIATINNINEEANINQAIAKIILLNEVKINKFFLIEILNSKIGKLQAERFLTVSSQPNINFSQIKSIRIPLFSSEKQTEIANQITEIRNQAKQLKIDATKIMIEAKIEVENIILGE